MQVMEDLKKNRSMVLQVFFILAFVIFATGCEDTESYKGVTFKPQQAEEKPFDTSVFVLVVENASQEYERGRDSISRHSSLIGSQWIPVNDVTLLFDGKRKFVPATRGMYNLTSVSGGTHTMSIATAGKSSVMSFQIPVVVKRGKMTIVLVDVTNTSLLPHTGYRICYQSIDYDFILKKSFQKLTEEYLAMARLVSRYERFIGGTESSDNWSDIFRKDCRDEEGHISDRLMALKYIQGTGINSEWHSSSWVGAIDDEYKGVILVRGNGADGKVKAFERFCVTRSKPGETLKREPQWKIVSIGIDI